MLWWGGWTLSGIAAIIFVPRFESRNRWSRHTCPDRAKRQVKVVRCDSSHMIEFNVTNFGTELANRPQCGIAAQRSQVARRVTYWCGRVWGLCLGLGLPMSAKKKEGNPFTHSPSVASTMPQSCDSDNSHFWSWRSLRKICSRVSLSGRGT